MENKNSKKLIFILIFTFLGLLTSQIPINQIVGSKQSFTLFEFVGPTAGAFLTGFSGALAVILVKVFDALFKHQAFDLLTILRLLPMALAALYFGTKSARGSSGKVLDKIIILVPLVCVALFLFHPEGRRAYLFSFFWLIPVIAGFHKENLWLRSLGATFTAHAVGSVIFLYTFNLPAVVWYSLIPVVLLERGVFTLGIASFYVLFNTVLGRIEVLKKLRGFNFEKKYLLLKPKS